MNFGLSTLGLFFNSKYNSFGPGQLQSFHTRASQAWHLDTSLATNLAFPSEDFTDANWQSTGNSVVTTKNADIAPNGSNTATLVLEDNTNNFHRLGYALTASNGAGNRRFSVYVKAAGRTNVRGWSFSLGDTTQQSFDLITGVASGTLNPWMQSVGNGWWRIAFDLPSGNTNNVVFGPSDGIVAATAIYQGDPTKGILVWGGMIELAAAGSVPSTYRPTTTAVATKLVQSAVNVLRVLPSPVGVTAALREPTSTNLFPNSDGFTGWTNVNALLTLSPLSGVSPAGTAAADKVSRPPTSNTYLQTSVTGAAGTYTFSRYFKASTANARVGMRLAGAYPNRGDVLFDLGNGTVVNTAAGGTATNCIGTIQGVSNGWYRCIVTVTLADPMQVVIWSPCAPDIAGAGSFEAAAGSTTADVLCWTAQLEQLSYATQPIPTTGATVTRARDDIVMPFVFSTGQPLSILFDGYTAATDPATTRWVGDNSIGIGPAPNGVSGVWNGTNTLNVANNYTYGTRAKEAYAGDGTGRSLVLNNGVVATDANTHPAGNRFVLAALSPGTDIQGPATYIHEFRIYPRRLPDIELKGITA